MSWRQTATNETHTAGTIVEHNSLMGAILQGTKALVTVVNTDGRIIWANRATELLVERTIAELEGISFWDALLVPEDTLRVKEAFAGLLVSDIGVTTDIEALSPSSSGTIHRVTWSLTLASGGPDQPTVVVATGIDMTDRWATGRALLQSQKTTQLLLNSTPTLAILTDTDGTILEANDSAGRGLGLSPDGIVGRSIYDVLPTELSEAMRPRALEVLQTGKAYNAEHSHGGRHYSSRINPVLNEDGSVALFAIFSRDITKRVRAVEELSRARTLAENERAKAEELATLDYLTGTLNRRALVARLEEEMERARRARQNLVLVLTDIDRFKKVNDTWGHRTGDIVLQGFTERLEKAARIYDFTGRYGGEEFVVCLPDTDLLQGAAVAERMRRGIDESLLAPGLKVTSSFGVAEFVWTSPESAVSLLDRADGAMYKAKAEGRNRVCLASPYLEPCEHTPESSHA